MIAAMARPLDIDGFAAGLSCDVDKSRLHLSAMVICVRNVLDSDRPKEVLGE